MAADPSLIDIPARLHKLALNRSQAFPSASTSRVAVSGDSPLLKQPNELLLKIAGYLAPTSGLRKNQGYGTLYKQDAEDGTAWNTTMARQNHAAEIQALIHLGLTCKRLVTIAQDIQYHDVTLPQPYRTQLPGNSAPSHLLCFLRTMLQRPELGVRVRKLAVWIWKGKLIHSSVDPKKEIFCACGTCMKALSPLVDRLKLIAGEKDEYWDLSSPNEAAVCALVFTTLPNLKTLKLYAKPVPLLNDEASELFVRPQKFDLYHLAQGLAATSVTTLKLSANLNGISIAQLPSLTTLTLDYSESNPFVTVHKGQLPNVTTLKIQTLASRKALSGEDRPRYTEQVNTLLHGLPKVTSIEFESPKAATFCTLPQHLQTLSFQNAQFDTLTWVRNHLRERKTLPLALQRIDMYGLRHLCKPHE